MTTEELKVRKTVRIITVVLLLLLVISKITFGQVLTDKRIRVIRGDYNSMQYIFIVDSVKLYQGSIYHFNTLNIGDTISLNGLYYEGKVNLGVQGQQDTLEVWNELKNIEKAYNSTFEQKVKQLQLTDPDFLKIEGIIMYLQEKLRVMRVQK